MKLNPNYHKIYSILYNRKFVGNEKKPHIKWIDEHINEILVQPIETRFRYTYDRISNELNLNIPSKTLYNLLYQRKIIGNNSKSCCN